MKINAEKCHFLIFGNKTKKASVNAEAIPSERVHIPLQIFLFLFAFILSSLCSF